MSVLRQETDPQTGPETGPQTLTISDDEDTDIIPFMGYALKGPPRPSGSPWAMLIPGYVLIILNLVFFSPSFFIKSKYLFLRFFHQLCCSGWTYDWIYIIASYR
jgi:hypothetical protein